MCITNPHHTTKHSLMMETVTDILPLSLIPPSPSSQAYLNHLTSLSLPSLLNEPGSLQTQSHHLTSSLSSLIHTAYPTFISLHGTSCALGLSLSSLSSSLDSLISASLPNLDASTSSWREKTEPLLDKRQQAQIVLEQHDKLCEILDIPILMETCVRNSHFSEALSLRSHVESLVTTHIEQTRKIANKGKDKEECEGETQIQPPEILSSVLLEVSYAMDQMHLSLLQTLYDPTKKLPSLWKAVNFLRKMDTLHDIWSNEEVEHNLINNSETQNYDPESDCTLSSEEQLALAFLTGRETCLKSVLDTLKRDIERTVLLLEQHGYNDPSSRTTDSSVCDREREDLARYLKKYIDAWREGIYDIIMQYSTIFLERLIQPQATDVNDTQAKTKPSIHWTSKKLIVHLHLLITMHATHVLGAHLLPILSKSFPFLSMSLLSPLLMQLTYCAGAFSRVGLDFRSILVGITEDAIGLIISRELNDISFRWSRKVRKAGLSDIDKEKKRDRTSVVGVKKIRVQGPPTTWLVVSSVATNLPLPLVPDSVPNIPPQLLASYPPLAALTNALVTVFNGLRLLAPIKVYGAVKRVLEEEVLSACGEALVVYIKQVIGSEEADESGTKERKVAIATGRIYFEVLVPFVRRALVDGVYGVKEAEELRVSGKLEEVLKLWEELQ
jgi:conserved oligomeric Golgi complex subunit 8